MNYEEFLRRVPKVELHCHLEGTVRQATFADLAKKHDVALPTDDVDKLYDYDSIYEFLKIFGMVSSTLIDREDFARVSYETLEDGVNLGNLKYREMFFNPTLHTRRGVKYATVVDGLVDGIRAAEQDLGVRCRLIADVYRQDPPEMAREMVEQVLAHRPDELIGLGMDGAEAPDPPEKFVESYRLAGEGGLRLTAHACEDAPAENITTCLDVLGCERIDHGYHILGDERVVERCRGRGHHLHRVPDGDGRLLLRPERLHDPPDSRDGRQGPEDRAQLRRPHDVPHGRGHGVREDDGGSGLEPRAGARLRPQRRRRGVAGRLRQGRPSPRAHRRARPARGRVGTLTYRSPRT